MNCKPGDMARIVKSSNGENVGVIVEVVKFVGADNEYVNLWDCKTAWPIVGYDVANRKCVATKVQIPDAWLRPIRPPETPVTETRDEELTV